MNKNQRSLRTFKVLLIKHVIYCDARDIELLCIFLIDSSVQETMSTTTKLAKRRIKTHTEQIMIPPLTNYRKPQKARLYPHENLIDHPLDPTSRSSQEVYNNIVYTSSSRFSSQAAASYFLSTSLGPGPDLALEHKTIELQVDGLRRPAVAWSVIQSV